jgi:hypothetical protein
MAALLLAGCGGGKSAAPAAHAAPGSSASLQVSSEVGGGGQVVAPLPDPCGLLTLAEVRALQGSGTGTITSSGKKTGTAQFPGAQCAWQVPLGGDQMATKITLGIRYVVAGRTKDDPLVVQQRKTDLERGFDGDPVQGVGDVAKYFPGTINVDVGNISFNLQWFPDASSAHDQPGAPLSRTITAAKAVIAKLP